MGEAVSDLARGSSEDSHLHGSCKLCLANSFVNTQMIANCWGAEGGTFALCNQKG